MPSREHEMPILKKQTNIFPDELLEVAPDDDAAGEEQEDSAANWWVLFTKSRQEKALASELLSNRIPFYLPLVAQDHFYQGRRRTAHLPLFSGYLFLFASEDERMRMLGFTRRLLQMINVTDQSQLRQDLQHVRRLIDSGAPLTVEQRLQPGAKVRVKSGTLQGMEGTITSRRSGTRLLIAVHFLQSGVSIEIDDYMVEPIS